MRVGLFLAAFVFAVVAGLRTMPARAMDGCLPPAGYMRSMQGQVEIRRGAADWRPAALDEPLCAGDLIRVGDRSRALAAIANLMQRIDQNTTLSLTYVPEDKPSVVGLFEGAVYFFSRKPRILEVDTPFFDAAVEGTEFLVRVEPQRALLTVFDGRITARNAQGELTVATGQSLTAEAGQAPAPYVLVRPRDAVRWALFYPIILLPLADRSGGAAREIAGPLGEAVELAGRGEYTAAFAAFEAIPEPDRGAEFYLYRAATLLSVGRVDEARADIDQALVLDPTDGRAYALSAVIAVAQNERDRALENGERGVELSPRSAATKIALSYAEQARFHIEAARETMQQAVTDEPENALAWARLSELWLMQGYRDRALKTARKGRKLAPELERTEIVLGFAALAAIDIGEAKRAFARAIALNSADPRARFGLGLATIRGGALERGRGEIELAVGLDPDDSLLRSYLGKAYFDERTTDPAKYLRELFTNFPNQENTLAAEQYAIAKRTIQPTQVAGFNQFFDDLNGTEGWRYAGGLDVRLTDDISAGVEASKRNLSEPIQVGLATRIFRENRDESFYRAYLYWTPDTEWAVSSEFQFDIYERESGAATLRQVPKRVETWSAPLSLRYFNPLGFFGVLTGTFIYQDVNREVGLDGNVGPEGNYGSFIVDTGVGYRFPQRRGSASFGVRNVFDTRLRYQDDNFREFREDPPFSRFIPERTILGRLTLNF
jgi:tetratricopeptide (TPR) repeat protein